MVTDAKLLQAWTEGDLHAGDRLMRRYWPRLVGYFRRRAGDERAEDLAQQTLLALLENATDIRGAGSPGGYLFEVARTKLADSYRRERLEAGSRVPLYGPDDEESGGARELARIEARVELQNRLATISPKLRRTLELFYVSELSCSELAHHLDIPEGTVKSRLQRARQVLGRGM